MVIAKQAVAKSAGGAHPSLRRGSAAVSLAIFLSPALGWSRWKSLPPPELPRTAQQSLRTRLVPDAVGLERHGEGRVARRRVGGDLGLRLVDRQGEQGLDSFHVDCMMERLAGPMETEPQVSLRVRLHRRRGQRHTASSIPRFVVTLRRRRPRAPAVAPAQRVAGGQRALAVRRGLRASDQWKKSAASRALLNAVLVQRHDRDAPPAQDRLTRRGSSSRQRAPGGRSGRSGGGKGGDRQVPADGVAGLAARARRASGSSWWTRTWAANLHTCLGLPAPTLTMGDFIRRRVEHDRGRRAWRPAVPACASSAAPPTS